MRVLFYSALLAFTDVAAFAPSSPLNHRACQSNLFRRKSHSVENLVRMGKPDGKRLEHNALKIP